MSQLVVRPVRISEVKEHPNADALELAMIEGSLYQVVVKKGWCQSGDVRLYVPLDAVIPVEVSDRWGVTKYLSKGRVRAARLRGETSYGFLTDVEEVDSESGPRTPEMNEDVAHLYGITKYEEPMTLNGEQAPLIDAFHRYTEIENRHSFPDVIEEGEEVVVTEKVHGTNVRLGHVLGEDGPMLVCGSHNLRIERGRNSTYEMPLSMACVETLLTSFEPRIEDGKAVDEVILFGETYGPGVQKGFTYGVDKSEFRAFDIAVDGEYLNWDAFIELCDRFGVPVVPVLYRGPFDAGVVGEMLTGPTTLEGDHIREGVVIRPVVERFNQHTDRTILKWKSDDYLVHKHGG